MGFDCTYHAAVPKAPSVYRCCEVKSPLIVMSGVLPVHETLGGLGDLSTWASKVKAMVIQSVS